MTVGHASSEVGDEADDTVADSDWIVTTVHDDLQWRTPI
jgi:hypothetical protein